MNSTAIPTTTTTKNTTLELTITSTYVQSWRTFDAMRELLQNAMDAHDAGFRMSITRGSGKSKTIYITNEGTTLERSALLLGTSTKQEGGFRGKFGEGLKLALLVLARQGIDVQVRTGAEMWTPHIAQSEAFGTELLKIKIAAQPKFVDKVEIQIHNINDEAWELFLGKLIDVPGLPATKLKKEEFIQVGGSRILTAERFCGQLYNRGLFVGNLPGSYQYGYDLADVQLDRDRKMADPWSFRAQLASLFRLAVQRKLLSAADIFAILLLNRAEGEGLAEAYRYGPQDDLTSAINAEFNTRFGADAVPVSSMAESMEAEHNGMRGVMVSSAIKTLVEREVGEFRTRKAAQERCPKKVYGYGDLTQEEKDNFCWVMGLVEVDLHAVQVVDFFSDNLFGTYTSSSGTVNLAKKILVDREELLSTLVHEVAHKAGDDGSVSHGRTIERMFSKLVVQLTTK